MLMVPREETRDGETIKMMQSDTKMTAISLLINLWLLII